MEFFEGSFRVLDCLNVLFQGGKSYNMGKILLKYFTRDFLLPMTFLTKYLLCQKAYKIIMLIILRSDIL